MNLIAVEEVFDAVAEVLEVRQSVILQLTPEPPPALQEMFREMAPLMKIDNEAVMARLMGGYAPIPNLRDLDGKPKEHMVWVRASQEAEMASISFVHELVHAAQVEHYGLKKAAQMNRQLMAEYGYENHPFELEAESMARFVVRELGLLPIANRKE